MSDHSIPLKQPLQLSRFFVDFGTLFFLTNVGVLLGSIVCSIHKANVNYVSIPLIENATSTAKETSSKNAFEDISPVVDPDDVAAKNSAIATEAAWGWYGI